MAVGEAADAAADDVDNAISTPCIAEAAPVGGSGPGGRTGGEPPSARTCAVSEAMYSSADWRAAISWLSMVRALASSSSSSAMRFLFISAMSRLRVNTRTADGMSTVFQNMGVSEPDDTGVPF